jgi:hypothetical protein
VGEERGESVGRRAESTSAQPRAAAAVRSVAAGGGHRRQPGEGRRVVAGGPRVVLESDAGRSICSGLLVGAASLHLVRVG